LNLDARIEHVLTKTHTARLQFQRNAVAQDNLGVGDFDLPARGYSQDQTEYIARLGDSGVFGKKFFNEVRLQARWIETDARSISLGRTILVPGSFNDGSAQRSGGRKQLDFELADNVDYALEKHGLRFGGQIEAGGYRSNERTNPFGTFQFADLAAYEAGLPTQFTQRIGDPTVKYRQYQFGWYVQDDFRVMARVTSFRTTFRASSISRRASVLCGRRRRAVRSQCAAAPAFFTTGSRRKLTNRLCAWTASDSEIL
jgi:hypothetical protein